MTRDAEHHRFVSALESPHLPTPETCPSCGFTGAMRRAVRDEMLRVADNVFVVPAQVDTCDHCGERVYDLRTVGELQALEARLENGDFSGFAAVGTVYRPS